MKGLSSAISRRSLLRAAGAGAVGLPFFRLLESSAVDAQAAAPPLRFLAVYVPDGYAYEYFRPRATGNNTPGSATETDFNLIYDLSVLAPLDPFKKKLLILDALDFDCHSVDRGWGHNAMGTILTGTPNKAGGSDHDGPSLDHYLASKIGQMTAVPQLNICVGDNYNWTIMDQFVFAQSGTWVSEVMDPKVIYNQIFGTFQSSSAPDPNADLVKARQKSKLDFVTGDINRLRSRVGATEALKLDVHLESIRSIERRLDASNAAVAGCRKPAAPTIAKDYLKRTDGTGPEPADIPTLWNLHADIVAQAFACDRTRVATMRLGQSAGMAMPFLGPEFVADNHNNYQHKQSSYRSDFKYDAISASARQDAAQSLRAGRVPSQVARSDPGRRWHRPRSHRGDDLVGDGQHRSPRQQRRQLRSRGRRWEVQDGPLPQLEARQELHHHCAQ